MEALSLMEFALNVCWLLVVPFAWSLWSAVSAKGQSKQPQSRIAWCGWVAPGCALAVWLSGIALTGVLLQPQFCEDAAVFSAEIKRLPPDASGFSPAGPVERPVMWNPLATSRRPGAQVAPGSQWRPRTLNFIPLHRHRPPPSLSFGLASKG